jgi:serine/threonine-protein kinase
LALPAEQRRAFLQEESSDDPDLHEEIVALLEPAAVHMAPGEATTATTLGAGDVDFLPADSSQGPSAGRWGHLDILRKVGEGHFGEVYLCRDSSLERIVALKLFRSGAEPDLGQDSSLRSRIQREGRLLARVEHPNVLRVYGVGVHDGRVGLWTEFVRGQTLEELLHTQGRYGAREASLVGVELCSALAAVHAQGVLHRDIKPHNVIREDGGRIILADFGAGYDLVRSVQKADALGVGTPVYMAPEVLSGEPASVRSDIYSMGVLLFHLVTGSYPVQGGGVRELRQMHARGERRLVNDERPDLPAGFVRVVETALRRDPGERFSSAGAMQRDLEAVADLGEKQPQGVGINEESVVGPLRRAAIVLSWLGGVCAALVFLAFLGFVTTFAYRVSLGVPREYIETSFQGYVVTGVRAMMPALVYGVLGLILGTILWWLVGSLVKRRRAGAPLEDWRRRVRAALAPIGGTGGSGFLFVVMGLGVLGVCVVCYAHREVLGAIIDLAVESRSADLVALSTDRTALHHSYEFAFTGLILAVVLLTWLVLGAFHNRRPVETSAKWALSLIALLVVLSSGLYVVPWRLLWDNRREVVQCGADDGEAREAFVVASAPRGEECRLWLFFPENRERRSVDCDATSASSCRRTGRYSYVFGGSSER